MGVREAKMEIVTQAKKIKPQIEGKHKQQITISLENYNSKWFFEFQITMSLQLASQKGSGLRSIKKKSLWNHWEEIRLDREIPDSEMPASTNE